MALARAKQIVAESCQIFVKNNMQWLGKPYAAADLAEFARQKAESGLFVFGHTGYLINLGSGPGPNRDKSLQSLIQEIQFATDLGLPFLVLHPGAHLGTGEQECLRQIVAGLNEAIRATKKSPVRIALENTAGQGTCLGHEIRHLAEVFQRVERPDRLGVCLDTAHLFAAGYDIRTPEGWNKALEEVDDLIGFKEVLAFHLNDSKTELGSRVDRHAGIGEGKIGREAFRHIVNDPRCAGLAGCLETPKSEDMHEDVLNLAILRELFEAPEAKAKKRPAAKRKTRD